MKKNILLSLALLGLSIGTVHAATIIEDALLQQTNYTVLGTFAPYDFEPKGDNSPFDWVFTMLSNGKSYQLQGVAPTPQSVFGWKEVSIVPPSPQWYMFQLNGDIDGDGSKKFDWILSAANPATPASYKLEGVSDSGTFQYSDKLNIDYRVEGTTITTGAVGTFVYNPDAYDTVEIPKTCSKQVIDDGVTVTESSQTEGAIAYDCHDDEYSLVGIDSLTITNIVETETVSFLTSNGIVISGTSTANAKLGTQQLDVYSSLYSAAECTEYYSITLPQDIYNSDFTISDVIESTFSDDKLLRHNCPTWVSGDSEVLEGYQGGFNGTITTTTILTDSNNATHTIIKEISFYKQ